MANSVQTLQFVPQFVRQMRSLAQEVLMLMDARNLMYAYHKIVIMTVIYVQFTVQESAVKMRSCAKEPLVQWDAELLIFVCPKELKLKEMQLEKSAQDIVPRCAIITRYCASAKRIVTVA